MDDFLELLYRNGRTPVFKVNIKETEDAYVLEAELPGFKKENIEVEYEGNILTIVAEKKEAGEKTEKYLVRETRYGKYTRKFEIEKIDEENISAKYVDGILTVTAKKLSKPVSKKGIVIE